MERKNTWKLVEIWNKEESEYKILMFLDRNEIDPNYYSRQQGCSLLGKSIRDKYFKVAKKLFELGADINDRTYSGHTILQEAIICSNVEGVEFLLKHGADKDKTHPSCCD